MMGNNKEYFKIKNKAGELLYSGYFETMKDCIEAAIERKVCFENAVFNKHKFQDKIFSLGDFSGAHFNPVVTLAMLASKRISPVTVWAYIPAQILGAIVGAVLANLMFNLSAVQISDNYRVSTGTFIGEVLATAGLLIVILVLLQRDQGGLIPVSVAAWIGSAYFFTSSTSFANPAVTVGRMFSDTFAGISPDSVLPFIGAQLVGAAIGILGVKAIK